MPVVRPPSPASAPIRAGAGCSARCSALPLLASGGLAGCSDDEATRRPGRAGRAVGLLVGRREAGRADREGAAALLAAQPPGHLPGHLAGRRRLLRPAGHPGRRRQRAGPDPDRRRHADRVRPAGRSCSTSAGTSPTSGSTCAGCRTGLVRYGKVDGRTMAVAGRRRPTRPWSSTASCCAGCEVPEPRGRDVLGRTTSPGPPEVTRGQRRPGGRHHGRRPATTGRSGSGCGSQGGEFYRGRQLGFGADELIAWFELWQRARGRPGHAERRPGRAGRQRRAGPATGGHRDDRRLVRLVPPAAGAAAAHRGRAGRGRLPRPARPRSGRGRRCTGPRSGAPATRTPVIDVINFLTTNGEAGTRPRPRTRPERQPRRSAATPRAASPTRPSSAPPRSAPSIADQARAGTRAAAEGAREGAHPAGRRRGEHPRQAGRHPRGHLTLHGPGQRRPGPA